MIEHKNISNYAIKFNENYSKFSISFRKNGEILKNTYVFDLGLKIFVDSIFRTENFLWLDSVNGVFLNQDERLRANKVFLYNSDNKTDSLLLEEDDLMYAFSIKENKNHKLIEIINESLDESQVILLTEDKELMQITDKQIKEANCVFISQDYIYKYTNKKNDSCFLFQKKIKDTVWKEIFKGIGNIDEVTETKDYVLVSIFKDNKTSLKFSFKNNKTWSNITMNTDVFYSVSFIDTVNLSSNILRFNYSSLFTPSTSKLYNLDSSCFIKSENNQFYKSINKTTYEIELVWVASTADNEMIPLYLYSKKGIKKEGCLLNVYGAYGARFYPDFSTEDILLLDEGITIAYAGVRGNSDNGKSWYYKGKLLNKKKSITDLIDCAEFLVESKIVTPEQLAIKGNSAGGVIVAQAINLRPSLFQTAILDHPFLDVLNTMLDSTLSLTTEEYLEWGNPNIPKYYKYIKSYSPYQNLKKQNYPNMYITSGFNDNQTPYWQVAKYVAKLRDLNTSNSKIIFRTDFKGGHTPTGSWEANTSFTATFIIKTILPSRKAKKTCMK